ncbi:MAG: DUF4416 family protein [Candidatus Omnitrophica bacterium]|nr:DUF4416 family protein [Candidatus Omnitrophota bacterium]
MGKAKAPEPVKLFTGIITNNLGLLEQAVDLLKKRFGPIDFESDIFDFDLTDYYQEEMGRNLKRQFLCFKKLVSIESGPDIKICANKLEEKFSAAKKRSINIDPGYISLGNLVLLTTKNFYHRIYLKRGIYAEVTLRFRGKTFEPFEWTYPDYKKPDCISFFNAVRADYLTSLRSQKC